MRCSSSPRRAARWSAASPYAMCAVASPSPARSAIGSAPTMPNQGYMTAAVRAVIPFVFDSLELHRLEAACLPTNVGLDQAAGEDGFQARGARAPLFEDQRRVAGPPALRAA